MSKTTYLFVSDFDRTLSLDDGGVLLSELIGISREEFEKKVNSIANKYFVQQGAELSYLIEYDPDYKGKIKREDFIKIGKKITLKNHIKELVSILEEGIGNAKFKFYINSAAPREMIVS
ncbi:haloacid dehalogenase-like hydrolase, partial [Candidatus Aminicenantes bacterium AC-335-B20]|nr:haloacid dehalogenase-like hydrolase [Candidatus Aminicenantes bacterium AC-335-B20]